MYSYPGNLVTTSDLEATERSRNDRFNDDDRNQQGGGGNGRLHLSGGRINGASRLSNSALRAAEAELARLTCRQLPWLTRSDLMPALKEGISSELNAAGMPARSIHDFLVHPMPAWKRILDILGAVIALTIFSPVMLLVAIGIKLTSGGPILFTQNRAGLGGGPFLIYKFRTMVTDAEAKKRELRKLSEQDGPAFKLKNDPRVTAFGKLPPQDQHRRAPAALERAQGRMSLVGPRPLPMDEADGCEQWQRRRLDVTPGLTCIWQVKGRSAVTLRRMGADGRRIHPPPHLPPRPVADPADGPRRAAASKGAR